MFRQSLNKFFSVAMALLVLFSTVSFTVEKHYCGDVLVDVSVFSEVDKCALETLEIQMGKTCCKDEVDVVLGQDALKMSSFEDLDFEQQLFLQAFVYSYLGHFEIEPKPTIPHQHYSPPKLVSDIHLLDQVFII